MSHVYVSYQREDAGFVAELTLQIEDAGYAVWPDHERFRDGAHWREAMDRAIRMAFAVVVVCTPEALASPQIGYEWTFALGVGARVIPVLRTPGMTLPPQLARLDLLDFGSTAPAPWGRLIRHIQEALENHEQRRVRPPADNLRSRFEARRPGERSAADDDAQPRQPRSFAERLAQRMGGDDLDDRHMNRDRQEDPGAIPLDAPDAIERLGRLVDSNLVRDTRMAAAQRLGETGSRDAVPALAKLLRDNDWRLRDAGARALGQIKTANAMVALLDALRFSRPGPFGGSGKIQTIADAIRDVGSVGVPVLMDALSDADPHIRLHVTNALGEIADPETVPGLVDALQDPEWRVRLCAADALGKLGSEQAVPVLQRLLRDSNPEVRVAAAAALGKIGDATVVAALVKLLRDREWRVRWTATEALWGMGAAAVPGLIDALHEPDETVRRAAMQALAEVGAPAIPALLDFLRHSDWDMQWAAAEALVTIGPAAVAALAQVLQDVDWRTAWTVAETLKRIGTPEALAVVAAWRGEDETGKPNLDEAP